MAAAIASAAGPAAGREIYEDEWVEARSPSFVVYSTLSEPDTAATAQELENFGQLVTLLTTIPTTKSRVPTYVFIFDKVDASVGFSRDVGGRFLPTMRANYATARRASGLGLKRVLQHEYTHFLVHNSNSLRYPRWFDEGIAELLSTATVKNESFTLGDVDKNRAQWLQYNAWLPYGKVIDTRASFELRARQTSMFYAQSWALVHYLTMGPGSASFSSNMSKYLALAESGKPEIAAFEEAFGEPVDGLVSRVRDYLVKKLHVLGGTLKSPLDRSRVKVGPMRPDDVAAALGILALQLGRKEESERYYRAAIALNPQNSQAMVGLADHLKFAGKFAEAEPYYRQAIERAPGSDNHHLDFGEYWMDRANGAKDAARDEFVQLARQQFVAAFKLNEDNPETLAMYGSSFMIGNSDPAKGLDTLELANSLLPANLGIKTSLARLYIALDRPADARPLLRSVIAWSHGRGATSAQKMLAEIDGEAAPAPEAEAEATEASGESSRVTTRDLAGISITR